MKDLFFKHMTIHDNLLVHLEPNNDMLINEFYNPE